jgi:hypothetical protein
MTRFAKLLQVALVLFSCVWIASPARAANRPKSVAALDTNSREIFNTSMKWGDDTWDPKLALCSAPKNPRLLPAMPHHAAPLVKDTAKTPEATQYHMVRESSVYALGLLLRDGPGDRARAAKTLDAVLNNQFHTPGTRWDGTFRRSPSEPDPAGNAVRWTHYDPNWREFIGTTFIVILNDFSDRIPADLAKRMVESIDYAVAGEIKEGRLTPSYTNISLMYGYMWSFAAEKGGKPEWKTKAEQWQEATYRLYKEHGAFHEYNSPTYCGTDLFGLALWREYGYTERTRAMGRDMEDGLWRASADLYNANLRNISGPYDRAYGMDMQSYVSIMGLWMRMFVPADKAPLVGLDTPPVDHVADLWFIPGMVALGVRIPDDAKKSIVAFQGEHEVRRPIEGKRIATAWIGKTLIYGGEITGHTRGVDVASQFHPATAQWLTPSGKIGWLNLTGSPKIDADATKKGLEITTEPGVVSFRIDTPGIKVGDAAAGQWKLSGLTVNIETDGKGFKAVQGEGYIDVTYTAVTRMNLSFDQTGR